MGYAPPIDFLISGGTILKTLHRKSEDDFYLEYASALKWGGHRRYINIQTNAKDKEDHEALPRRGRGLPPHANMEVWDKRLFEWINPGKNRRIGWDNWVKWMIESGGGAGRGQRPPQLRLRRGAGPALRF